MVVGVLVFVNVVAIASSVVRSAMHFSSVSSSPSFVVYVVVLSMRRVTVLENPIRVPVVSVINVSVAASCRAFSIRASIVAIVFRQGKFRADILRQVVTVVVVIGRASVVYGSGRG